MNESDVGDVHFSLAGNIVDGSGYLMQETTGQFLRSISAPETATPDADESLRRLASETMSLYSAKNRQRKLKPRDKRKLLAVT